MISITYNQASDERLTRIEQAVESNNCFLESFTSELFWDTVCKGRIHLTTTL